MYQCKNQGAAFHSVIGTGSGKIMERVKTWMVDGKVKAIIDREFDLEQADEAVAMLRGGHTAGKIIVNVIRGETNMSSR
jgi:NADPH:quinone reductase-like Zn-dependent oxidoreductase